MVLEADVEARIYTKLVPYLGEEDANAFLMATREFGAPTPEELARPQPKDVVGPL